MWPALKHGAKNAARFPALLLLLYGAYTFAALGLNLPIINGLNNAIGHRLAARDLAQDFNILTLLQPAIENTMPASVTTTPSSGNNSPLSTETAMLIGLVTLAGMGLAGGLIIGLVASLPNALFGGGILTTYAEGRFGWRRFLGACWRWALPLSALLGLFTGLVGGLLTGALIAIAVLNSTGAGGWSYAVLAASGLLYALLAALFDYARVIAVCAGRRNIFWALGQAAKFIARRPLPALGLYLAWVIAGILLLALYNTLLSPLVVASWFILASLVEQLFIGLRLWLRLGRWATLVALYQNQFPPTPA